MIHVFLSHCFSFGGFGGLYMSELFFCMKLSLKWQSNPRFARSVVDATKRRDIDYGSCALDKQQMSRNEKPYSLIITTNSMGIIACIKKKQRRVRSVIPSWIANSLTPNGPIELPCP